MTYIDEPVTVQHWECRQGIGILLEHNGLLNVTIILLPVKLNDMLKCFCLFPQVNIFPFCKILRVERDGKEKEEKVNW